MRGKRTVGMVVALLLIAGAAGIGVYAARRYSSRGDLSGGVPPAMVAATVNGRAIHKITVEQSYGLRLAIAQENHKLMQEANPGGEPVTAPAPPTKEEILQELIRHEVLLQEAERLGLTATDEEVDAYYSALEESFSEASPDDAQMVQKIMDEFLKEKNMTYDEYRETVEYEQTRKELSIQKLYDDQLAGAFDRQRAAREYTDGLVAKADIEIY